jgi:hypothetical protein
LFKRFVSATLAALTAAFAAGAQDVSWSSEVIQIENAGSSWTRMVHLRDGSWLAAYTIGPSPTTGLRVKRSFDDMRTWTWISQVWESGRNLDNANLYQRPDGVVLLAMRSLVTGRSYRINVYQSSDSGNSWQFLSTVDRNEDKKPGGLWEPFLLGLPDGRMACFYANETHSTDHPAYSQIISERISDDGGLTWGGEIFAVAQPGTPRPGEPNVVRTNDGFLLFYEVCGSELCVGHTSWSPDGVSWPGSIGPAIPSTYQNPQGLAMDTGVVLAISNEKELLMGTSQGDAWVDTGTHPFGYGSWPALYQISPSQIAMVITGGGDDGEAGEYVRFGQVESATPTPRSRIRLPFRYPVAVSNARTAQ